MKKVKIIIKIIVFFAIFIGIQYLIKFATLSDGATYGRLLMRNIYAKEKNIDILICGASHCQFGLNNYKMSEKFEMNAVNAGTSQQGLETSLAIIKEVARYYDLKKVYVDLDYSMVTTENPNLESIYLVSDYFRPSLRKVDYLLNATPFEHYFNSFMPLHNGREYRENPKAIAENIKMKLKSEYYNTSIDFFYNKWYSLSEDTILDDEGALWTREETRKISEVIPEKQYLMDVNRYLKKIIEFCDNRGIEVEFICIPSSDFHMSQIDNYDQYVEVIRNFLKQFSKEYYDFNLCKEEELPLNHDKYFWDDNHLNGIGATIFTEVLCDFYQGRISEDQLFWSTYEEKEKYSTPRFLGFKIPAQENMGLEMNILPVTNNQELDVDIEIEHSEDGYLIKALIEDDIVSTLKLKDEH